MCWTNTIAIPLVLKKPLIVYKVGTSSIFGGFISLYRDFMYRESQTMPTVKINPEFVFGPRDEPWSYDNFYIYEGYHSYLTEKKQIVDLKLKWIPKPFEKIIALDPTKKIWTIDFFSYKFHDRYLGLSGYSWDECLPYNEETAKLIGTTNNVEG